MPLGAIITLSTLNTLFSFCPTHLGTVTVNTLETTSYRSINLLQARHSKSNDDTLFSKSTEKNNLIFGLFPRDQNVVGPLSLLLISQFILFIGVGAVIPSIPLYGKEIGLSSASNGIVISAPAVTLLLASKFGGNFADLARKRSMIIGMAIIAISDVGTAIATSIIPLVVARLGLGLGRCVSEAGERGMLADLANRVPEVRGSVLAAQSVAVALGIAIGAPAGGYVVEEYGPRASFLCVSAAALLSLCIYFFLPETIQQSSKEKMDTKTSFIESIFITPSEAVKEGTSSSSMGDWGELLQTRTWKAL